MIMAMLSLGQERSCATPLTTSIAVVVCDAKNSCHRHELTYQTNFETDSFASKSETKHGLAPSLNETAWHWQVCAFEALKSWEYPTPTLWSGSEQDLSRDLASFVTVSVVFGGEEDLSVLMLSERICVSGR